ncbi:MAG TPA: LytTR family DNA-binding domain-containing protein [Ideonella sp.]|jgi:two-component system LytT family response regulator|nr:LytTR family DNA-binding domain-containing protein [Ideonella sp.]
MKIRTLIVDDEPLARLNLATLLQEEEDFEVVGECADAASAAAAIAQLAPQLLFLDVQMPGMDGFELLDAVHAAAQSASHDAAPMAIVFVTAHAQFAVQAFEAQALDYLLKPFRRERFEATLERVRHYLSEPPHALPETGDTPLAIEPDRMVVKSGHKLVFIPFDELELVRAAANYVTLHFGHNETLDVREKIGVLAQRLPAARFLRIHRSYIVNLAQLRALYPVGGGEYMATLRNGRELPVGPSYPAAIRRALEQAGIPRFGGIGVL